MTITEFHNRFKLLYDTFNNSNYPTFEPQEIDDLFNLVIRQFVKTRYGPNNLYRASFEEIQKRTDDLRTLVTYATIAPDVSQDNFFINSKTFTLPNLYWFIVRLDATITYKNNCGETITETANIKQVTHDSSGLTSTDLDPFAKPFGYYVNAIMNGNKIRLLTGNNVTIVDLKLSYIKQPAIVSVITPVQCDLPDHTHDEIIQLTVQKALEIAESQRVQSHMSEIVKVE